MKKIAFGLIALVVMGAAFAQGGPPPTNPCATCTGGSELCCTDAQQVTWYKKKPVSFTSF